MYQYHEYDLIHKVNSNKFIWMKIIYDCFYENYMIFCIIFCAYKITFIGFLLLLQQQLPTLPLKCMRILILICQTIQDTFSVEK